MKICPSKKAVNEECDTQSYVFSLQLRQRRGAEERSSCCRLPPRQLLFIPETDVWPRGAVFIFGDMIMIKEIKICQAGCSLQGLSSELSAAASVSATAGGAAPTSTMVDAKRAPVRQGPDRCLGLPPSIRRDHISP